VGTERLILLAIADHINGDGIAWPSAPRLARMCATTERHVRRILPRLVERGELEIVGARGAWRYNVYRICLGKGGTPAPLTPGSPLTQESPLSAESVTPDLQVRKPLTCRSCKPIYNRKEPLSVPRKRAPRQRRVTFAPPSPEEARAYAIEIGMAQGQADAFMDHFISNGWRVGARNPMRDWRAAMRNWLRRSASFGRNGAAPAPPKYRELD